MGPPRLVKTTCQLMTCTKRPGNPSLTAMGVLWAELQYSFEAGETFVPQAVTIPFVSLAVAQVAYESPMYVADLPGSGLSSLFSTFTSGGLPT